MTDYAARLAKLIDNSLSPSDFSHIDHIGVAYQALSDYEFFEASFVIASGIQRLAARAGLKDKFNATVTMGFISVIAERMAAHSFEDPEAFIKANADLVEENVLANWYSKARVSSEMSRRIVLMPDLLISKPAQTQVSA